MRILLCDRRRMGGDSCRVDPRRMHDHGRGSSGWDQPPNRPEVVAPGRVRLLVDGPNAEHRQARRHLRCANRIQCEVTQRTSTKAVGPLRD
jgi:hypothetical protein